MKMDKKVDYQQIVNLCVLGLIIIGQYVILELSGGQIKETLVLDNMRNIILGFGTVTTLYIVVLMITSSYLITAIISSLLITVLSIVNYFVIEYHGQPFTIADLSNIKSAMTVMKGYSFSIKGIVLIEVVGFFLIVGFSVFYFKNKKLSRIVIFPFFIIALICIYFAYLSPNSYISRADVSVNWVWALQSVGYTPYFVHRSMLSTSVVREPSGFKEAQEEINNYMVHNEKDEEGNDIDQQGYPDIILILNETFYDVDLLLGTETHKEVLGNYDKLDCIKGFTISPQTGGGTNCSEYELLTSNSIHLIPYVAPFAYLNMKGSNSIISFLKNCGYNTTGMHQFDSTCYSRNIAYPGIGFDNIMWREDCQNLDYYANRSDFATDRSVYENLIKTYEEGNESGPKCIYCLTIQNHGHFEHNEDKDDLIRIKGDFGEYTDDLNEYLSCMKLSDEALGYLISYYENVDRNVIVVMAGDHCPSFLPNLISDAGDVDINLKIRSTPFLIWSNHIDLDKSIFKNSDRSQISMNYLVPLALKAAGMPLSGYYEDLIELREYYPILDKDNGYYDSEYEYHSFTDEKELPDILKRYYYIEYINIEQPDKVRGYFY